MSNIFDITTPQKAMEFLLTNLRFSNFVELSNEFNVNCERELDVFAERNLYTPEPIFDEHNEEEKQLLSMFRELNEDGKNAVIAMITRLTSNDSYK